MVYNKNFEELLKTLPDNEYVGLGNPNAKILFIGKEAGTDIGTEIFHGNTKSWKVKEFDYSKRYIPIEPHLRNLNHTWQRYQKLYDKIVSKLCIIDDNPKKDKYEITFLENIFTTEFSNMPAKTTNTAKKQIDFRTELEKRKLAFFNTNFIEQFSIIVIFANDSNYIETYSGEVSKLFKVKFDYIYDYPGRDKIWIHSGIHSGFNPKLLIHTRQLTNSISKDLLDSISEIITNFIKANSLNL
ncbi:hypothetical protein [Flavobacterium limnophilum]|uniref:hypothetical protein n=1 Tax=Flavobacterium limnophilum TaxID=3003262 RepID=UPI0022ABE0EC|nr:hypothetical protein [Flavobacterium limnophilum]